MRAGNDSYARPRRRILVYMFKNTLAPSFQVVLTAALRRVFVRADVVLKFVLADVCRCKVDRVFQQFPLSGVRNAIKELVSTSIG